MTVKERSIFRVSVKYRIGVLSKVIYLTNCCDGEVRMKERARVKSNVGRLGGTKVLGYAIRVTIVLEVISLFKEAIVEVVVVVKVFVLVAVQIRPDEPSNIALLSAFEVSHTPQSVRAKDDAPENIFPMLVTLDTSHLEMSPLNDDA